MLDESKIKETAKNALKGVLTVLLLTLGVTILVHVVTGLYDLRVVLGVLAGKFGYDLLHGQIDKIRSLE